MEAHKLIKAAVAAALCVAFVAPAKAAGLEAGQPAIADSERAAIMLPLQLYVRAHESGNGDFIVQAFHRDAKINGHIGGSLISWTVTDYAARFSGKPADDEAQRRRKIEILDVEGNAAVGRITLDYPRIKFTDYMALLKIDGEWKIISKSFHAEPKN